jgi:3-oxoacyl-(acyl-carrier-protein) synthase
MYGCRLIKNGLANRVIVGGADSLAKFTVNGFNALRILSDEPCAPFDQNRKGLNLGEGAAFLVLEKEADATGKKIYAEVSGYGNANDAYHPSSLSPEGDGPYLAMKNALDNAGLKPADIDFINAHGTGTENNDEVESRAMLRLFNTLPGFASTKGFTGHTLGAASAIEAVYSILNIDRQELYPNLNFNEPITDIGFEPVQAYNTGTIKHVMSNSFGFGGNCTSLIFSKA